MPTPSGVWFDGFAGSRRTMSPVLLWQPGDCVTASSWPSERHATSHARMAGVTSFGLPRPAAVHGARKSETSEGSLAFPFAAIATCLPSGENAESIGAPVAGPTAPCADQLEALGENGFVVVNRNSWTLVGSATSWLTVRIAFPSGDQAGRSTLAVTLVAQPTFVGLLTGAKQSTLLLP